MRKSVPSTAALARVALAVTISVTPLLRVSAQTSPAAAAGCDVRGRVGQTEQVGRPAGDDSAAADRTIHRDQHPPAPAAPAGVRRAGLSDRRRSELAGSDRFDIVAKAPDGILVPSRCGRCCARCSPIDSSWSSHNETREMPIYALVMARPDGKLGPKLKRGAGRLRGAVPRRPRRRTAAVPPQPGEPIQCGFMMGPGTMTAGGMPLLELARSLSQLVGGIVVDKTGLKERYDFQMTYAPEGRGLRSGSGPWRR